MAKPASRPALPIYRLRWWDFEQQKAMTIDLPFKSGTEAFRWMINIPGLDNTKKCGAFPLS